MHQPYEINLGFKPDFKVRYRFYEEIEGGRKTLPYQGYRSDFWYFHEKHPEPHSIFVIRPEFEDQNGNVIIQSDILVSREGSARMWVVSLPMRKLHRDKINVALKGYFMEGPYRVAECEVVELVDLTINPTQ
jgi:hypothetical protein